jgi:iron complex outermembrane receptor protein
MRQRLLLLYPVLILAYYPCAGKAVAAVPEHDTSAHVLNEVVIFSYAPPALLAEKYSVGTQALYFKSAALAPVQHFNLSDYLQTQTAIHFKEKGKGMHSSISLRGTAASHAVLKWNGFNLNVPTMGESDFSHLPLFFFDEVKVHTGGESVLYGSGALGGSIELKTLPKFNGGLHADVRQTIGSYGYTFTGGVLRWSGKRWESRSSLLYTQAANNYEFENTNTPSHRRDTLKNAAYRNWGVLQEIYYRAGDKHLLSARFWYMDFYREIQPMIAMNDSPAHYDDIYDSNLRALLNYSGEGGATKWNVQAGYARDEERFHEDIIAADKLVMMAEGEHIFGKWTVKAGVHSEYIKPDVYAYTEARNEWRNEAFVQALWNPAPRWMVSGGLRQTMVTDVQAPLTPSLGMSYIVWRTAAQELKLRGAFSRNIKVPSLNDRYWNATPVSLQPEVGTEGEAGLDYVYIRPAWFLKASASAYYNRIADWIRWLPSRPVNSVQHGVIWRPQNIGVVDCYGLEVMAQAQRQWRKLAIDLSGSYAYTPAIMREGTRPGDTGVGQQAAFQPKHIANMVVKSTYEKTFLQAVAHYVGQRHSTDIFDVLEPYVVVDFSGGHTFEFEKLFLSLMGQVNNLFDADYQNMKNYAMPGRNYMVTLRLNF